jgi:hypothetical protein
VELEGGHGRDDVERQVRTRLQALPHEGNAESAACLGDSEGGRSRLDVGQPAGDDVKRDAKGNGSALQEDEAAGLRHPVAVRQVGEAPLGPGERRVGSVGHRGRIGEDDADVERPLLPGRKDDRRPRDVDTDARHGAGCPPVRGQRHGDLSLVDDANGARLRDRFGALDVLGQSDDLRALVVEREDLRGDRPRGVDAPGADPLRPCGSGSSRPARSCSRRIPPCS